MNIFVVLSVLSLAPSSQPTEALQVLLLDRHPDGPYKQFLGAVYAGVHGVVRPSHYDNKLVGKYLKLIN